MKYKTIKINIAKIELCIKKNTSHSEFVSILQCNSGLFKPERKINKRNLFVNWYLVFYFKKKNVTLKKTLL